VTAETEREGQDRPHGADGQVAEDAEVPRPSMLVLDPDGVLADPAGTSELYPDVLEGLSAMAQVDLRLSILTDSPEPATRTLLERHAIDSSFEQVWSTDGGPRTDAAQAYETVRTGAGVGPQEILVVSARPAAVHSAREAGLPAAWVNRSGATYPAELLAPDLEATSLVDLSAQLGAVGG
jgi:2-haloacid dehalogenase